MQLKVRNMINENSHNETIIRIDMVIFHEYDVESFGNSSNFSGCNFFLQIIIIRFLGCVDKVPDTRFLLIKLFVK